MWNSAPPTAETKREFFEERVISCSSSERGPAIRITDLACNAAHCLACASCHAFVGSLDLQMELQSGAATRATVLESMPSCRLPEMPGCPHQLNELLPCRQGCGQVYCSEGCLQKHWSRGHRLLCTGALTDVNHPLVRFKTKAPSGTFLLVADMLAELAARLCAGHDDMLAAAEHFSVFCREMWWDVKARKEEPAVQAKRRAEMKAELAESASLFHEALREVLTAAGHAEVAAAMEPTCTADAFGALAGCLELNQVAIVVDSPLRDYARQLAAQERGGEGLLEAMAVVGPCALRCQSARDEDEEAEGEWEEAGSSEEEGEEEGEEDDDDVGDHERLSKDPSAAEVDACSHLLFKPYDGAGLFTLICMANHSCLPNTEVRYISPGTQAARASLVALRDIAQGNEIYHSYIDEGLETQERKDALLSYGFQCGCEKCMASS
ncbi:hypothetical protein CYMTET_4881 [Cymbomonas tetramitiformis]|uniref:SET domain-containing protein n=1 Tax=Cymbomonas tetramitiformis TaxID=36881 RepID=A0AAE0H253_9CHLO|nr:hypothetical protein CYMTET_4881 [Cymbomonas tetramitiformis]